MVSVNNFSVVETESLLSEIKELAIKTVLAACSYLFLQLNKGILSYNVLCISVN